MIYSARKAYLDSPDYETITITYMTSLNVSCGYTGSLHKLVAVNSHSGDVVYCVRYIDIYTAGYYMSMTPSLGSQGFD